VVMVAASVSGTMASEITPMAQYDAISLVCRNPLANWWTSPVIFRARRLLRCASDGGRFAEYAHVSSSTSLPRRTGAHRR
jgi:hypothetical protein